MPKRAGATALGWLLTLALAALLLGSGPAAAEPRQVRFGCFVTSISGLSPADGSFRIAVYFWTVDPAARFDPVQELQVLARQSQISPAERMLLPDGSLYVSATIDAVVDHDYDVRDYPFERDTMVLKLESNQDTSELSFVPDSANSRIADFADLPGWRIDGLQVGTELHTYDTGFGHRTTLPTFSRLNIAVDVSRNRSLLILGKFTGYLIAFLITGLVFAVPPGELGIRLGMTTSSIFAAVFNRYRLEDAIGFDAVFGLVDQATLLTFSAILWAVALSLIAHRRLLRGDERAAVARSDRRLGAVVMVVHLALLAAAFASALT